MEPLFVALDTNAFAAVAFGDEGLKGDALDWVHPFRDHVFFFLGGGGGGESRSPKNSRGDFEKAL